MDVKNFLTIYSYSLYSLNRMNTLSVLNFAVLRWAQAGLKLALQPGITLNSASCICVLSVEITGRNHLPDFMNPGIHACYTSILPTELHTVLRPRSVF